MKMDLECSLRRVNPLAKEEQNNEQIFEKYCQLERLKVIGSIWPRGNRPNKLAVRDDLRLRCRDFLFSCLPSKKTYKQAKCKMLPQKKNFKGLSNTNIPT